MIKTRTLKKDEKNFGKMVGYITGNVLKEFNPIPTPESDLEDMQIYGKTPLVEVFDNGEIIGVVKWNNNLGTLYYDGTIGESAGITQLSDGRFVLIGFNYGEFNSQIIHNEEAHKMLDDAEILDNFLYLQNTDLIEYLTF